MDRKLLKLVVLIEFDRPNLLLFLVSIFELIDRENCFPQNLKKQNYYSIFGCKLYTKV